MAEDLERRVGVEKSIKPVTGCISKRKLVAHSVGESAVCNQLGAQLEQALREVGFGSHEGRLSIELRRVDDSSRGQYESHGSDSMVGVALNRAPHPPGVVGDDATRRAGVEVPR